MIPAWEQENQRPFLVNGTRFLDELDMKLEAEAAEKESKKVGFGEVRSSRESCC